MEMQDVYQGGLLKKAIVMAAKAMMHARATIPPTMMAAIVTVFVRESPFVSPMEDLLT
jgi:hypothetical protein